VANANTYLESIQAQFRVRFRKSVVALTIGNVDKEVKKYLGAAQGESR
jgi:hypothetical protein